MQLLIEPRGVASSRPARIRGRIAPVVWLNLVCLDAPIVAITWQWFFARDFHLSLTASSRAALFLTSWLIYLADRFADTWALQRNSPRSLRQEFCQRHQTPWIAAIAGIALLDLWIIAHQLDRGTIRMGMLIGAFSLIYLAINYWLGKTWRFLPIKEICVGSLFAVGTVAALLPQIGLSTTFATLFSLCRALLSELHRHRDLGARPRSCAMQELHRDALEREPILFSIRRLGAHCSRDCIGHKVLGTDVFLHKRERGSARHSRLVRRTNSA